MTTVDVPDTVSKEEEMQSRAPSILFIITQSELGGAQRHVLMLAIRLRAAGLTPVVVCGGDGELPAALREGDIEVHILPHLVRPISPVSDIRAVASLVSFIRSRRFDIVHCHSTKAGIVGRIAARLAGSRIVLFTVHGCVLNEPMSRPAFLLSWMTEWFAGLLSTRIIAVSEHDRDSLIRFRATTARKISVIRNGIEMDGATPQGPDARCVIREAMGFPRNALVIGTTANFYRTKALDVLIRAAALVAHSHAQAHFALVGDGMERPSLELLIEKLGLRRNVILLGQHPHARDLLPAFDLFVLPSRKEGMPLALLEAMAAGLPVVATNVGGMPEVVTHGKTGLIVPPEDPDSLAEAILSIASEPALRKRYGEAGRTHVNRHFSLDTMFDQTMELYRREAERAYGAGALAPALDVATMRQ